MCDQSQDIWGLNAMVAIIRFKEYFKGLKSFAKINIYLGMSLQMSAFSLTVELKYLDVSVQNIFNSG